MIGFLKVIHVNVNHTGAIVREIVIQDRHSHYCPSSFFLNVKTFHMFLVVSDQHQVSPNNISTSSRGKVMRISKMISKKQ